MIKRVGLALMAVGVFACNNSPVSEKVMEKNGDNVSAQAEDSQKSLSLEPLWQSDSSLITNESVYYYEEGDFLLVSNIEGNPTDMDGKGSIAKLSTDGKVLDAEWATGINAPKGMCVLGDKLFVSDINQVVAIDMNNTSDRDYYKVEGAVFLNDLSTDGESVYISDMRTGKLHRISSGILSLEMDSLASLNGLCFTEGKLYGLNAEGLLEFDLQEGTYQVINDKVQGGDGLVSFGKGQFIASRWQGEVWFVDGEEAELMLSSQAEEIQTADIGYNPNSKTLYVPRFFSNYVSAYSVISD